MQFNDSSSEPFEIHSGVKQGRVLAPTLFGIFFGLLLKHAVNTTTEGIYLRTRSDGRLFNLARLRAKTKVREVLTRDMLFADDAAVVTHTQEELHSLMECFSHACKDFGLPFNSIQFNSIKFISTFIHHYMSIIIIIHCIFLNEKSKWICRKLNKLIRDIPGITHNQFT